MEIELRLKQDVFEIEIISLKYLAAKIKRINGSKYNQDRKRWEIPVESIDFFNDLVRDIAKTRVVNDDKPSNGCVHVQTHTDMVFSKIKQYHPDVIQVYKSIPGRKYDPEYKCWSFPKEQETALINALKNLKNLTVYVNEEKL